MAFVDETKLTNITSTIKSYADSNLFDKSNKLNAIFPVGSIYTSVSSTSPASLFGGTWERITGKFLLAATDGGAAGGNSNASIAAGNTGGEATHALTAAETATKNHTHTFNAAFQIRHGEAYGAFILVKASTNSSVASGGGDRSWANGYYRNGYTADVGGNMQVLTISGSTGGQTEANGSAHNNMPPYLAVYVWKRTA